MKFENIIIEMIQHDVEEIATKEKELVGKGAFHNVYPSNKNPNIVYNNILFSFLHKSYMFIHSSL